MNPRRSPVKPNPAADLLQHLRLANLPEPTREYRFHHTRKWRLDFAWPDRKVAVEVEGGTWGQGGHVRGSGFRRDCEKYNALALLGGWTLLRVTTDMVRDGSALAVVERALRGETE